MMSRMVVLVQPIRAKSIPQGLKPDVFAILYGPTKVVPRYKTQVRTQL
jgi:hypothetical protein